MPGGYFNVNASVRIDFQSIWIVLQSNRIINTTLY
jgi:hypothetical protein